MQSEDSFMTLPSKVRTWRESEDLNTRPRIEVLAIGSV